MRKFILILTVGWVMFFVTSAFRPLPHDIAGGKKVFTENCTGCHGENGGGGFGPNLTDHYFLHGHHMHNIVHIVKHGNKNGMSAFNHRLSHSQIHDVAHFVLSLKGTCVANGKAPQGKFHK